MTTLAELRDRFLDSVDDGGAATWSAALVEDWLGEAMHDFALRLPPLFESTLVATAGTQTYELDGRARGVISVAYPAEDDPPRYLRRLRADHPLFFRTADHYDLLDYHDEATPLTLLISATPAGGEQIEVRWTGTYEIPDAEEEVPVPEQYHHILLMYCTWRAQVHQLMSYTSNPDLTTQVDLLRSFSTNAERSRLAYELALATAGQNREMGGPTPRWQMDRWDRVY